MTNWGIIGCGGIARRRMIPALPFCKESQVVAVMDVNKTATDEVAKEIGAKAYYTEADLLADPDVRCVYIATPVFLHKDQVLAAAAAGKHILLEKPIALSISEAEEMLAACKNAGVYLIEGYMMKHHALNVKAKELIESGGLGQIVNARAQLTCWYPDMQGAWRQDPKLGGGGSLMDMATHCYDLLQYIIGSKIVEVFAYTNTLTFKYPVEDSSTTLLRFENGAQASVEAFFNIPDAAGQGRMELYGTRGSIQAEGTIGQMPGGKMVAYLSDDAKAYDPTQDHEAVDVTVRDMDFTPVNMYASEMDYLSRCVADGVAPSFCTGEDGLYIMRVTQAAYESSKTGKKVTLE